MPEVFFIGDTHFGHKGILNFSSTKPFRPFDTIEEHDEELIKRWNNVVGEKDIVFHLGDVAFGLRNISSIGRCNGNKRLIMGNHDTYGIQEYLKYFNRVFGCFQYEGLILSHIPIHECQLQGRFIMNVHGHLHANNINLEENKKDWRYFNVSCEQINLTPIPYHEILDQWASNN